MKNNEGKILNRFSYLITIYIPNYYKTFTVWNSLPNKLCAKYFAKCGAF